jgi:hypothetical protein
VVVEVVMDQAELQAVLEVQAVAELVEIMA